MHTRDHVFQAQAKAHNAAVQFQRANSIYQVAKETVGLAEERVTNDGNRKDFDSAWQEMLNHATTRVSHWSHDLSKWTNRTPLKCHAAMVTLYNTCVKNKYIKNVAICSTKDAIIFLKVIC